MSDSSHPTKPTLDKTVVSADKTLAPTGAAPLSELSSSAGYEILSELGRGGMGVVYKARQIRLNRVVALKMILHAEQAGEEEKLRFQRESEALAQLKHENIVQVHEVGEIEGKPFFSLEFVEGCNLDAYLNGDPFPPRLAAQFIEILARAIHCAHDAGIVHRDIKPANILIADCGGLEEEELKDGPTGLQMALSHSPTTVKITDFGLAKRDQDQTHTQAGAILGSPSYMAPEQAEARTKDIGPGTDIHALGVILYEMLTGRNPFKAGTIPRILSRVAHEEPVPPRALSPSVPRDLETICLKCLEKKSEKRYSSARALAEDLRRYRQGESISARSYNVLSRLARTLEYGQQEVVFRQWSTMLLLFAGVVLTAYSAIQIVMLQRDELGRFGLGWVFAIYVVMFSTLALIFWKARSGHVLPTSAVERQLWSIWIGYFLSGIMIYPIGYQFFGPDWSFQGRVFPFHAILGGLTWFHMGSGFWGGFYVVGLIYFGAALLMAQLSPIAPLLFGLLWSLTLTGIAFRLRYLARREEETGH